MSMNMTLDKLQLTTQFDSELWGLFSVYDKQERGTIYQMEKQCFTFTSFPNSGATPGSVLYWHWYW